MRHHLRRQRGSSLFEALVASLVLAVGLVGLARMQGQQRADADSARQRDQAVRLAQDEIERLRIQRPFATIASSSGRPAGRLPLLRIGVALVPNTVRAIVATMLAQIALPRGMMMNWRSFLRSSSEIWR